MYRNVSEQPESGGYSFQSRFGYPKPKVIYEDEENGDGVKNKRGDKTYGDDDRSGENPDLSSQKLLTHKDTFLRPHLGLCHCSKNHRKFAMDPRLKLTCFKARFWAMVFFIKAVQFIMAATMANILLRFLDESVQEDLQYYYWGGIILTIPYVIITILVRNFHFGAIFYIDIIFFLSFTVLTVVICFYSSVSWAHESNSAIPTMTLGLGFTFLIIAVFPFIPFKRDVMKGWSMYVVAFFGVMACSWIAWLIEEHGVFIPIKRETSIVSSWFYACLFSLFNAFLEIFEMQEILNGNLIPLESPYYIFTANFL